MLKVVGTTLPLSNMDGVFTAWDWVSAEIVEWMPKRRMVVGVYGQRGE
jgi:hypothetical protein